MEQEGVNVVSYYSIDMAGNTEEAVTIEVKIDQTAPVTTSDILDTWSKEAVIVNLHSSDAHSGVAKTFYSINGSEVMEGTSFIVDNEGINQVTYYSVDIAGNVEVVKTIEVKVDYTKPGTTSNVTDNWSKEDVTVVLSATDNLSGVEKTLYSIQGSPFLEGTQLTISNEGIFNVSYYSVDIAGNMEEFKSNVVKIDKTAPTITWGLADEYVLGTVITQDYIVSDNLSGIATEQLTVNGQPIQNGELVAFDKPGEYQLQLVVTDHAGWTTTFEKTVVVYIPAEIIIKPGKMNINKGKFKVEVNLPEPFATKDFDLLSATLDNVSAIANSKGDYQQAARGQFTFERLNFTWNEGENVVEFRGMLGDLLVVGKTTLEVIKDSNKENDGEDRNERENGKRR